MRAGIPPLGDDGDRAGGGRVGVAAGRTVPASVTSSSPPTSHAALPSTSPTLSAVNTLSTTFSSLAGLVGRAAPAVDEPTAGGAASDRSSVWQGGSFDRLPGRWNSSQIETVLVLHTLSSVSIFALPPAPAAPRTRPASSDLREILHVLSSTVGEGVVRSLRVVPPPTLKGSEWSLLVVLETPSAVGRQKISVALLALPSLQVVGSRTFAGALADVKTSSHTVAVATVHPPALHILHPSSLASIVPPLVAPAIALDVDRRPIFDVRARVVAYASSERPPKDATAIARSSAGARKLEEGVAGLSRLSRSRRGSGATRDDDLLEQDEGQSSTSSQSRPIPTPSSPTRRRTSTAAGAPTSSSSRSVMVLALAADPDTDAPAQRLVHFASDGVASLALSPSASMLLLSASDGHHSFSVLSLRPRGLAAPDAQPAVWETHVLHRGLTPARLDAVVWSDDEKWVGATTAKGTTHFWLLGPARRGLSDGRDVCVRVRQPAPAAGTAHVGFAFARRPGGPRAPSLEQDVVFFDAADGQHASLRRLSPPAARPAGPVASAKLSPSPSSRGSALSLMMSASRKAQALVAASTSGVLEGGHGDGTEWEMARWELGNLAEEAEAVPLALRAETPLSRPPGDAIALALSHAEIETSTPSPRILPGPLYLSHQFSFSAFSSATLPKTVPLRLPQVAMQRLVVRSEVVISRSPALEGVQSLSSSIDSFVEPLSSAIHSSLAPHSRSFPGKPVVPSYPNGDGLTTSPRSWKSSAVGMPIVVGARSLGDGLVRVRHEVGRIASPSGSFSSRQRRSKQSTSKSSGGLSFDEDAVYDPSEFQQTSAGSGSFAPSSFSTDPEEPWEDDEEEKEEGYRALAEEEASFDDLVLGVMDEDDGRDGSGFRPHAGARSASILGLDAPSLKSSSVIVLPASLPPPAPLLAPQQPDEDLKPSSDSGASAASSLTRDERKLLNKARKQAARGGASVPGTPATAASLMVIARSTSATGRAD